MRGKKKDYLNEKWYTDLKKESKYVIDLIIKYHNYFSRKDKILKRIVQILKILTLFLAMSATIILGLSDTLNKTLQTNIGLVLSAIITFITAISSFLNLEKYWMRNISIHIELNKLRDSYIFEAKSNDIDKNRTKFYMDKLDEMQTSNIKYWQKTIKNN